MNNDISIDIDNSFWRKESIREPPTIFYDMWSGTIKIKAHAVVSQTKSVYKAYFRIKAILLHKSFKDRLFSEGEEYIFHLPSITFEKQIMNAKFDRRNMTLSTGFIFILSKSGKKKALRILSAERVD